MAGTDPTGPGFCQHLTAPRLRRQPNVRARGTGLGLGPSGLAVCGDRRLGHGHPASGGPVTSSTLLALRPDAMTAAQLAAVPYLARDSSINTMLHDVRSVA